MFTEGLLVIFANRALYKWLSLLVQCLVRFTEKYAKRTMGFLSIKHYYKWLFIS